MNKIRKVTLELDEDDCKFLEKVYGTLWFRRMQQHIHNEVTLRRREEEKPLKIRKPWNY
jgi:hypothetical protein